MDSTIMRSLVDNIGFEENLWKDLPSSSDSASSSSFVRYSTMELSSTGAESVESECPCMPPPPDFDIGPPPKFSFFLDGGADLDFEDSCDMDFGFPTTDPQSVADKTSVNQTLLIFIITAAIAMITALIVFTVLLIWCQKRGWCKRWSKPVSKMSAYSSETDESTVAYATGAGGGHKTEWAFSSMKHDKKLPNQLSSNVGILMYGGDGSNGHFVTKDAILFSQSLRRPLPTLPRHVGADFIVNSMNRPIRNDCPESQLQQQHCYSLYDSHNPVYEEISLNGLPQQVVDSQPPPDSTKLPERHSPTSSQKSFNSNPAADSNSSDSPCSCQSCGKSASIDSNIGEEFSPSPQRKLSVINQSTQSEDAFLHDDAYCECTNNGRESGYGTEGYPARDFGTWDSPKRSTSTCPSQSSPSPFANKMANKNLIVSTVPTKKRTWLMDQHASRKAPAHFAIVSNDSNLGSGSAYV